MRPQGKARSGDRVNNNLTNILERLVIANWPTSTQVKSKPLTFDDEGDMEYFMFCITEAGNGNYLGKGATLLHLRESPKDETKACGRAATITRGFKSLRARYGVSSWEARQRLMPSRRHRVLPAGERDKKFNDW